LSKRLIRNSLLIRETELGFIDLLKKESGKQFVRKLEIIIQDILISKQINLEFSAYRNQYSNLVFFKVIDNDAWILPNKQGKTIELPEVLDKMFIQIYDFYKRKFKCKSLKLAQNLGWFELYCRINNKKYILICSLIQYLILLQFNLSSNIPAVDIQRRIGNIEDNEFSLELSHLLNEKILVKSKDNIKLNKTLDYSKYKIVLNNSSVSGENKNKNVDMELCHLTQEDRKFKIDAAIIKVLKKSKILDFSSIDNQVKSLLESYFNPQTEAIKLRIENLLDRNLIIRDELNNEIFKYNF
jgi:hypothetical protein